MSVVVVVVLDDRMILPPMCELDLDWWAAIGIMWIRDQNLEEEVTVFLDKSVFHPKN